MQSEAKPLSDDAVLELAYRYLNRRERTTQELRAHLEQRGVDGRATEQAIAALGEQGYVDDARFARVFAEDKRTLEQWGSERIARALRARGIGDDLIEAQLGLQAPALELQRACELLARRFPAPPRTRRERDRALGVLLRKGYPSELALDALRAHARTGSEDVALE